jgi:hypothetical protein
MITFGSRFLSVWLIIFSVYLLEDDLDVVSGFICFIHGLNHGLAVDISDNCLIIEDEVSFKDILRHEVKNLLNVKFCVRFKELRKLWVFSWHPELRVIKITREGAILVLVSKLVLVGDLIKNESCAHIIPSIGQVVTVRDFILLLLNV